MKIAISTESTCDLSEELIDKYNIKIIAYPILLGEKTYLDGEIKTEEIFDFVKKTGILPKTAAINEYEYSEYFSKLKKEYDAVVHVSLSSKITTSTANSKRAAEQLEDVYVVDSLSLSTGLGLLVRYAAVLAESKRSAADIYLRLEERKKRLQVSFVIERLDYLYKGGRCNSLQYLGANLLKLRPRIVMKNGQMSSDSKFKGAMPNVVGKYCQSVLEEYDTPDYDCVFITYTTASDGMLEAARSACRDAGFRQIFETHAGGTIASHCGENTLGILYFNDGGENLS